MELSDPAIFRVLDYLDQHPEGADVLNVVSNREYREVIQCLLENGLIEPVNDNIAG